MAYENLCMYCFEDLGGQSVCPHCGRDAHAAVPQIQMLPGTLVYHDRFLIGRALGQDSAGIVYAALDTKKENKLRIREYLPRDCAERLNDGTVVPVAGMEDKYDAGIRKLRASVEDADEPRKRHFFFEENGTAYIVQRKGASQSAEEGRGREASEEEDHRGRTVIIVLVAAIAVVAAAVALILIFNGSLNNAQDLTQTPTADPNEVWIPAESPTATPYTSPTFAALVDPDLSWMDYTYEDTSTGSGSAGSTGSSTGSTGSSGSGSAATRAPSVTARPTAAPTVSGSASGYQNINANSSASAIRALQQKLVTLGWLDYTNINGSYDAATRQAVRDFQSYVNLNYNPSPRLAVDGVAGPKTQQWLYQASIVRPSSTSTPTPKPRVTAKPDDDAVVDADSSANRIRAMQRELILLGVLPEGADNGSFDATTRSAVRRFQNRVNQLQGYEVLEVSGKMDALSMAFLDYYVDEWRQLQTATATPTARPTRTPAPTATPTAAPTATKYASEKDPNTVNAQSSREAVQDLQRTLIDLGMLAQGTDDGIYGTSTAQAVSSFQRWVNQRRGEETLSVTGEADPLTRSYLRYCRENGLKPNADIVSVPTATPTLTPTPVPEVSEEPEVVDGPDDVTIDSGSDRESIRRVQELLADVGLISNRGIDGIYGNTTVRAVRAFQEYVNAHGGELEVSGIVDNATRLALEYYSDEGMTVNDVEETPTPVPAVTEEEDPQVYDEAEEDVEITVDPDSNAESISYVQQMLSAIGALSEDNITGSYDDATAQAVVAFQNWINREGITKLEITGIVDNGTRQMLEYCYDHDMLMENEALNAAEAPFEAGSVDSLSIDIAGARYQGGAVEVDEDRFSVQWSAEGAVESYYVYVSDSSGNEVISAEAIDNTSFNVDASRMNPGETYTVTVGALPVGGGEDDIVWQSARFVRPAQGGAAAAPEAEITAVPATPTAEPLPTVGTVEAPQIAISGSVNDAGVVEIEDSSFRIRWKANGGVQSYNVQITDDSGNEIANQSGISQTELTVRASQMRPGAVYTIAVGAIPVNGSSADVVWSRSQFTLPVAATPAPTEAPTPEPTEAPTPKPQVAEIGRPSVTVGGSGYQQDGVQYMTDSTIIISWGVEGDVEGYSIYVENQDGERQNLGTTTDTSRTVSAGGLPAGVYTVYVGAIPLNGTLDDAQWGTTRFGIPAASPTAAPASDAPAEPRGSADEDEDDAAYGDLEDIEDEVIAGEEEEITEEAVGALDYDAPIDADSDSDTVQMLQMRLYRLGVMGDEPVQGVLDEVTLEAVAEFQSRANEQYDAGLTVLDPGNPDAVVDVSTLRWISRGL